MLNDAGVTRNDIIYAWEHWMELSKYWWRKVFPYGVDTPDDITKVEKIIKESINYD